MKKDYSLDFEYCVRQFLGDKAYHIADSFGDPARAKYWIRRCLTKAKKRIDKLDTTTRHKEMLLYSVEKLDRELKRDKEFKDIETIIAALWLISRLLGYDYANGVYNEPFYYQTPAQQWRQRRSDGKNWKDDEEEKSNWINARREVIKELKVKKYADFDIAQILSISEYELKKLKHNL